MLISGMVVVVVVVVVVVRFYLFGGYFNVGLMP